MAKGKGSGGGKNYRSAVSGRFVTKGAANKSPKTTLGEVRGGGSTYGVFRSAISGKFVNKAASTDNDQGQLNYLVIPTTLDPPHPPLKGHLLPQGEKERG